MHFSFLVDGIYLLVEVVIIAGTFPEVPTVDIHLRPFLQIGAVIYPSIFLLFTLLLCELRRPFLWKLAFD